MLLIDRREFLGAAVEAGMCGASPAVAQQAVTIKLGLRFGSVIGLEDLLRLLSEREPSPGPLARDRRHRRSVSPVGSWS